MKKTALIVALVALMTFAFATAAFAHHQPSLYVSWETSVENGGADSSPHQGYAKNSEKCNVCHAVHRAPVQGLRVSEQHFDTSPATELKGNRTAYYADPAMGPTQMLLQSSVANACTYCHIATNVGGVRIYNGNVENYSGSGWQANGYSHSGCSNCHSVHGAYTFQGALTDKIVKYTGAPSNMQPIAGGGAGADAGSWDAEHMYTTPYGVITVVIQDEVFMGPTAGKVASGNQPLFDGLDDTIAGTLGAQAVAAGGIDAADAQVSALCTICHANYSSASEQTVNLDGDIALFTNGYWDFSGVLSAYGTAFLYRNHPVGPAAMNITAFSAAGDTTNATQVSWATAGTCRSCHDAGVTSAAAGVVEQSWPHFTPGQWMFTTSGDGVTAPDSNPDYAADLANFGLATPDTITGGTVNYGADFASGSEDGQCLKCHNGDTAGGVGKTF